MKYVSTEDINFLEKWTICEYDGVDNSKLYSCEDCDKFDECMDRADSAERGYYMFCDAIVGCGYDSMEEFWECNGI